MKKQIRNQSPIAFSMRLKLVGSFLFLIASFLCVGLFNWSNVGDIKAQTTAQSLEADKQTEALRLKQMVEHTSVLMMGFMVSRDLSHKEDFVENRNKLKDQVELVGNAADSAEERKWKAQLDTTLQEYLAVFDQAEAIINDHQLPPSDVTGHLSRLYSASQLHKEFVFETIDQFIRSFSDRWSEAKSSTEQKLNSTAFISMVVPVVMLFLTVFLGFYIIRSFDRPIKRLQLALRAIASGDLSHKIGSVDRDELGELSRGFDSMVEQVSGMLSRTKEIAFSLTDHAALFHSLSNETAAANSDIVKAIEEIAEGADRQAQLSEQSYGVIRELNEELGKIREHSKAMQESSDEAETDTRSGMEAVEALHTAARQMEQMVEKVAAAMHNLSDSSSQIGKIVQTITDISTQTNILSLNAAIEASRADAAGKGFSIIAEEVRSLSQQSNESSKHIARIILQLQQQMKELDRHIAEAHAAMGIQKGKVEETHTAFFHIQQSMHGVSGQIGRVRSQVECARDRSIELNGTVQVVAGVAQQTAAGVQQVNSTSILQDSSIRRIACQADDISRLAGQLFEEISRFNLEEHTV